MQATFHIPVLGPETIEWLATDPDGTYVDATVGGGGHAAYLLDRLSGRGRLIGIDRDPEAIRQSADGLSRFGTRFESVQAPFWELPHILGRLGLETVSGILFDLGVSSHQIDSPGRGFSFQVDGPLDMRMGPDATRSARDVVGEYDREELAQVFLKYGEDRASRRIATAICRRREQEPITRTQDLAEVIRSAGGGPRPQKTLARIFQAIRIEVNQEIGRLEDTLTSALDLLGTGGRLAVLSYHSLEDRTAKQVLSAAARGCICPPDLPVCGCGRNPTAKVLTTRGQRPSAEEILQNPRARSATLRVAERLPE